MWPAPRPLALQSALKLSWSCCLSHSFTLVRRALLGAEIEITPQRFGLRYMPAAYVSDATLLLDEKKVILRQMKPLMAELRKKRVGQCV